MNDTSLELTPDEDHQAQLNKAAARDGLANTLQGKFTSYKSDRSVAEQQWLRNLRQYLGQYDPEFEQRMPRDTSRAYPKYTRVKCKSLKARLMSLLFPAGERNWGVDASPIPSLPAEALVAALETWRQNNDNMTPTQQQLDALVVKVAKESAEKLEMVIADQLQDVDPYGARSYEDLVGPVVESAVLYGPGIVKGPMTVADTTAKFQLDPGGVVQVVEVDTYRPYLEFVSCWDYFPDLAAPVWEQMEGEFQRHLRSRHQLLQLAKRSDFDADAIRKFVQENPQGNYNRSSYENEIQAIGGQSTNVNRNGAKYELLEYWGSAAGEVLRQAGLPLDEEADKDDVRFTAWVLGNRLIKLALNPFPEGTKVFHQFVFEDDEVNLMGSGLPPIVRDSQLGIASSARMLIDNASVVCGPSVEINTDVLDPGQADYSIKPFQVYRKSGGTSNERLVQSVSFDSHMPELLEVWSRFKQTADDETFVSPMTGGDLEGVPGEAMRTTGGASMVYGNAALPFRDIVRNFDRFTVSVIHAFVEWNKLFNEDRDQLIGDTRPIPKGATSLMAKEIRAFALDQLATTLTPEDRLYINGEELLKERLRARDLPLATLMASEEEVQRRQTEQAQQAQTQAQQAAAMFAAQLKNLDADTMKQLTQGQKNLDNADVAVFKALIDAIKNGADADELATIAARTRQGRSGQQGNATVGSVVQLPGSAGAAATQIPGAAG